MSPTLPGLLDAVGAEPAVADSVRRARLTGTVQATEALEVTAPPSALPAARRRARGPPTAGDRPVLAVTATAREAEDLAAALASLLPEHAVAEFPAWETLPHERLSPSSDTVGRRLARAAPPRPPERRRIRQRARARARRADPRRAAAGGARARRPRARPRCSIGDEVAMDELVRRLAAAAYTRTDLVDKRGQFAVRGGILDVFPPTEEHPVRLEFWGDTVEEIRWFKVADQRSLEIAPQGLWAPPCRELLLTDEVRARAQGARRRRTPSWSRCSTSSPTAPRSRAWSRSRRCSPTAWSSLVDLLPEGSLVVVCDPERVRTRAHDLVATSEEFLEASWHNAAAGNVTPIDLRSGGVPVGRRRPAARHSSRGVPWWGRLAVRRRRRGRRRRDARPRRRRPRRRSTCARPRATAARPRARSPRRATCWPRAGPSCWSRPATARPSASPSRCAARASPCASPSALDAAPEPGLVTVVDRRSRARLRSPPACGSRCSPRPTSSVRSRPPATRGGCPRGVAQTIDPLQLKDRRLRRPRAARRRPLRRDGAAHRRRRRPASTSWSSTPRPSAGSPATGSTCPTDQLDQVTRYVGGESPSLHRLGGADWTKTKARARKAVRQIAGELIRLYAARMASRGLRVLAPTPCGSASSRTRSRTTRRPTSSRASTRSRPTWRTSSPWTASSAATSATARPRSPCARRSRRCRTASRSRSSCRRRCSCSSTCRRSPSGTPPSR